MIKALFLAMGIGVWSTAWPVWAQTSVSLEKQCPGASDCSLLQCRWTNTIELKADVVEICWTVKGGQSTSERTTTVCKADRAMLNPADFKFEVGYKGDRSCSVTLRDVGGLGPNDPDTERNESTGPCGLRWVSGSMTAGDGCVAVSRAQAASTVNSLAFQEYLKLTCSCDGKANTYRWCFGLELSETKTGRTTRRPATQSWGYETDADDEECRKPRGN